LILVGWDLYFAFYPATTFARQLFAFENVTDISEFTQKTNQCLMFSWHRPVLMAIIELILLVAISKSISFQRNQYPVFN